MAVDEIASEWRFRRVIRILTPVLSCFGLLFPTFVMVITRAPLVAYLFMAAGALVACAVSLIVWTSTLRIADGTLAVKNVLRTHTVALRDIQSVTRGALSSGGLVIICRDGTKIWSLLSFGHIIEWWDPRWFRLCDEVEQRINLG